MAHRARRLAGPCHLDRIDRAASRDPVLCHRPHLHLFCGTPRPVLRPHRGGPAGGVGFRWSVAGPQPVYLSVCVSHHASGIAAHRPCARGGCARARRVGVAYLPDNRAPPAPSLDRRRCATCRALHAFRLRCRVADALRRVHAGDLCAIPGQNRPNARCRALCGAHRRCLGCALDRTTLTRSRRLLPGSVSGRSADRSARKTWLGGSVHGARWPCRVRLAFCRWARWEHGCCGGWPEAKPSTCAGVRSQDRSQVRWPQP